MEKTWKILVVDDDEVNLKIAVGMFKRRCFAVEACTSGKEALLQVDNCEYDLILLDHVMPEMDGMQVLDKIRKGGGPNASTIIFVLTSYAEEGLEEAYCQAGFDGYICKPLTIEKIDEVTAKLIQNEEKNKAKKSFFGVHSEALDFLLSCKFDIDAGMSFAKGNVMLYQQTLQMFSEKATAVMEEFTKQKFSKNYSTYREICENQRQIARNIGATALYNRFFKHIMAVNNREYDWIDEDFQGILTLWTETADNAKTASKL